MWKRSWWVCLALLSCSLPARLPAQQPLFAEDFESGMIDPKIWDGRTLGPADISIEEGEAAHGKYALRIHYPQTAAPGYAFIVAMFLPDLLREHLFGRAYVKIDAALPEAHTALIFAGSSGWPSSRFEEIGAAQGALRLSYRDIDRGEDVRSGGALPVGKWFLLEWELNDDPTTLKVWVDGKEAPVTEGGQKTDVASFKRPVLGDINRELVGGYLEFGVGVRVWGDAGASGNPAFDVYYDDIALGSTRMGGVKYVPVKKTARLISPPVGR